MRPSQRECHVFDASQPRGLLHRAFSVFLFNEKNELLLQKRSSDKITFPGVWTNTCCSHPLFGYEPTEVEEAASVAVGEAPATISAAIRKLDHELGIPASELPRDSFKFQTRLHYCARDDGGAEGGRGEGEGAMASSAGWCWGEHEMDYILLMRTESVGSRVTVEANPEEVEDHRYVSQDELRSMMTDPNLRWSPWFRIIEKEFLHAWWNDLDRALETKTLVDNKIHKLDIPQ